ncbi:ABC transporter ATP-binding protein [Tepidimicrobium xylanilyticum]|uniref:Putative ABC transport system ATP-binding protein n=1 Tax=Tepidimicrobium xylanilyticum TaxID=1123352 RepID=A0A1H2ZBL6_9FIRM|nr:ATP-binding cassette domain-containing protein [Tepidimicrobium xylanilyticum]GMG96443.1 ABC transporter ATP-binding protein [Tepidimicrobium xylanilyticum]SDX14872.1 putative ABC transport system ATP-binding protein [Tepidimicrobium xylanilyticum]
MLIIKDLSKSFNKDTEYELNLFNGFNIKIEKNKCTAIIGPNGCGKSTLLNLIGGSIRVDKGQIILDGKDITNYKEEERAKYIGRVYQNPSMGVSPSLTILENMALADKKGEKFILKRLIKKNNIDRYRELLKELNLDLENKLYTKVKYLSGGQRQSLSLIMAAMKIPNLLLLDEHTAALDPKTSNVVMKKTKELIEKYAITTIMISHNMKDAIEYSDRIIMLDKGNVILDVKSSEITENQLIEIYRHKLESAA